jgi:hypothetical protein
LSTRTAGPRKSALDPDVKDTIAAQLDAAHDRFTAIGHSHHDGNSTSTP